MNDTDILEIARTGMHDTTGQRDLLETCGGSEQEQLGLGGVQLETSRSAPITDVNEAIAEVGEDGENARRKTMRLSLNVISEEVILEAMILEVTRDVQFGGANTRKTQLNCRDS
jgi:hypothetical protein